MADFKAKSLNVCGDVRHPEKGCWIVLDGVDITQKGVNRFGLNVAEPNTAHLNKVNIENNSVSYKFKDEDEVRELVHNLLVYLNEL